MLEIYLKFPDSHSQTVLISFHLIYANQILNRMYFISHN